MFLWNLKPRIAIFNCDKNVRLLRMLTVKLRMTNKRHNLPPMPVMAVIIKGTTQIPRVEINTKIQSKMLVTK